MRVASLLLVASLAGAQPISPCNRPGLLSPKGIGELAIGMPEDSVARLCTVLSRTKDREYELTILAVRVGTDTVRAFVREGRISWIEVQSPRIRTDDSVGVGASATSLLHLTEISAGPGDGANTFALSARSGPLCGLTFWLDAATAEMLNAARGDRLRLLGMRGGGMRGGGVITQVDIHGECPGKR